MTSAGLPSDATLDDDFGISLIAQHNLETRNGVQPPTQESAGSLGVQNEYFDGDQSHLPVPPTPQSNAETEGMRTRSGRSTRRADSPLSSGKGRVSKSPSVRPKKEKKSKVLQNAKTPKLTAPLSVLTKDMTVPLKDMDAWVHRPASVRREEVEKRHGYVTRPMNSFMLYRSAFADRTKQWATQNNHQVVSSVAGESWPMEPAEVRDQFNEWAKIERANHAAAHPNYKFSPSKSAKKRKGEFSDDEDNGSDLDGDPDGEYRVGGRSLRQRRRGGLHEEVFLNPLVGFETNPYYGQHGYDMPQYYCQPGHVLPSNAPDDGTELAHSGYGGGYIQQQTFAPQAQQGYSTHWVFPQELVRFPTPASQHGEQSLGTYGLPSQMSNDDFFGTSRTSTPAIQQYASRYSQTAYVPLQEAYSPMAMYQQQPMIPAQQRQIFEHQQYLQAAAQPQITVDPGLLGGLPQPTAIHERHLHDGTGDLSGDGVFVQVPEYYEESTSPNQTLAPRWDPTASDFDG